MTHSNQFPTTKAQRKPILYWRAYNGKVCIDENNSIAILRHKYKGMSNITFATVR